MEKKILAVSIFLILGFLVALASGGLLAGIYSTSDSIPQNYLHETDDGTSYVLEPGIEVMLQTTGDKEKKYLVETNIEGLRDPETLRSGSNSSNKVVVIGDSMTFGWGLNRSSRFTEQCEEQLDSTDIINAGVPGYGMEDYRKMMTSRAMKVDPDTVVIVFSRSDAFPASESLGSESSSIARFYQALRKRWQLSTQNISETEMPQKMDNISRIARENSTDVVFMSYWPFPEEERAYLKNWAEERPGIYFQEAPSSFREQGMNEFIFSREDPHLTPQANDRLSENLCNTLEASDQK